MLKKVMRHILYRMRFVPDELYLTILYFVEMGQVLDLEKPSSFNEKMQWLKLHDRNPLYTVLVDKYEVKEWVADRIGRDHVLKTYRTWESVDDVSLEGLPEKFVLKTNHDSGGVAICSDRSSFDLPKSKELLKKSLNNNYFYNGREWPYKGVKPLIFAEEYLEPNEGPFGLADYKLFRFSNGRLITLVCEDRIKGSGMSKTFFDEEWHVLKLSEGGHPVNSNHPMPQHFRQMREFADRLAQGFPFMCVDFYESAGQMYFGEVTLYPNCGFERFNPSEWDTTFGQWIDLSLAYDGGGWLLVSKSSILWMHEEAPAETTAVAERPILVMGEKADLVDYKFMCFNGEVKYAFTCTNRSRGDLRVDFFDNDWNHLPFKRHYPNADTPPAPPVNLCSMQKAAERLSAGIPFVRVDFYEVADSYYFGEMTFYPGSGFEEFEPVEWDRELGSWIDLSMAFGPK